MSKRQAREFVLVNGSSKDEFAAFRHVRFKAPLSDRLVRRWDAKLCCEVVALRGSPCGDLKHVVGFWRPPERKGA